MMLFDKNQPPCAVILLQGGWFMQTIGYYFSGRMTKVKS